MIKTVMEAPQLEGPQPWGLYELTRLVGKPGFMFLVTNMPQPGEKPTSEIIRLITV
jgi:hypothetical protein